MLKEIAKKTCSYLLGTDVKDMIPRIKAADCEIVSFDIFDTLVKRRCGTPHKIFDIVEQVCAQNGVVMPNYAKKRIKAEEEARKKKQGQEITISDIYQELSRIICRSEYLIQCMEWEIEEELKTCHADLDMKRIFDWVVENGYIPIITSDMYLNRQVIEKILNCCGYTAYKNIYLSNEKGYGKNTGYLYRCILEDYKVAPEKIVHVGDHPKGDYFVPKRLGIKVVLKR